jgi:5-formyltetrahydrofolate cyclo-ligase
LTDQKQRLRKQAVDRRAEAHAARGAVAGVALAERFCGVLADRMSGAAVSLFWPIGDEIDVTNIFAALAGQDVRTALPVMAGRDEPLTFRAWTPGDPLVDAAFGVREPEPTAPIIDPDIVAVPLLAFDATGNRLGYGGGYYDRTLCTIRAQRDVLAVGICYDEQEFPVLPRHGGDEPLDMILTDRRTILAGQ